MVPRPGLALFPGSDNKIRMEPNSQPRLVNELANFCISVAWLCSSCPVVDLLTGSGGNVLFVGVDHRHVVPVLVVRVELVRLWEFAPSRGFCSLRRS